MISSTEGGSREVFLKPGLTAARYMSLALTAHSIMHPGYPQMQMGSGFGLFSVPTNCARYFHSAGDSPLGISPEFFHTHA